MRLICSTGECPKCGEGLEIKRYKSGGRAVKCEDCEFGYALPRAGRIEPMGIECPKFKVPIIKIEKGNKKKPVIYFWAKGPCFGCSQSSGCEPYNELLEEYDLD